MKLIAVVAPDPLPANSENGGTVATAVVFAVLGWIILISIVVAIIFFVVKYIQHQRTKTLRL